MQSDRTETHLDVETTASYLDGRLTGDRHEATERHLASCVSCRAEIVQLAGIVRERPRHRVLSAGGLVAAAAAILFFIAGPRITGTLPRDTHRDAAAVAPAAVQTISPRGTAIKGADWRWNPVTGADRYEITVLDPDGRIVWDTTTAETLIAGQSVRSLEFGSRYYWRVRARLGWDEWVSSEFVEFEYRGRQ